MRRLSGDAKAMLVLWGIMFGVAAIGIAVLTYMYGGGR